MKTKIKENLFFILSLVMLIFSGIVTQYANAFSYHCRSCGGPSTGGECYDVNIGGEDCLFDTYGACHTAGSCS